jgi:hypothetical protein
MFIRFPFRQDIIGNKKKNYVKLELSSGNRIRLTQSLGIIGMMRSRSMTARSSSASTF